MNGNMNLKRFRRAGVPLVAVETADAAATLAGIVASVQNGKSVPVVVHDVMRGARAARADDETAAGIVRDMCGDMDAATATGNPGDFLRKLDARDVADTRAVFVCVGAAGWLSDYAAQVAVWNLRDLFKASGASLVLLLPMGGRLPAALASDVVQVVEELPDGETLAAIVGGLGRDAGIEIPADTVQRAADALSGLSAFAAEQSAALSISKAGLDLAEVWERKRGVVEQTRGLSILKAGGETFADLGGLESAKGFLRQVLGGKRRPRVVVFIDEIEKAMGGAGGGDLSGTKQDMLGALLSWWQDYDAAGCLYMGHPGSGKSALAKAAGAEVGLPCVRFDFSGMQASLVGESGANLRQGLAVVNAIAGGAESVGRVLVLATCNGLAGLAPELRRRFTLGQWFFDLPTAEERAAIWSLWLAKYQRDASEARPKDDNWTGAEIRQCCDIADRCGVSLCDASAYVVPVARSSSDVIEQRRREAAGKLLSASYAGPYKMPDKGGASVGRSLGE